MIPARFFSRYYKTHSYIRRRRMAPCNLHPCVSASVHSAFKPAGIVLEKVALQDVGKFEQQFCVNACAVENLVDVRAVAIQLPRKPNH